MNFTLKDLLDVPRLQELLDSLDNLRGIPASILDIGGNILATTASQDLCTKSHCNHANTKRRCLALQAGSIAGRTGTQDKTTSGK